MLHFACLVPKAIQVTLPSLSFYRNTSEKNDYISIKIYHFINSGERKLTKSILNFNKWEKGQTDLCEFVFADLGEIEFITIGSYHPVTWVSVSQISGQLRKRQYSRPSQG